MGREGHRPPHLRRAESAYRRLAARARSRRGGSSPASPRRDEPPAAASSDAARLDARALDIKTKIVAIIRGLPPAQRALACQCYFGQPLPGMPETETETETQASEPGDASATVRDIVRMIADVIAKQRGPVQRA
jgi:hypothetical protein